jgi:hypothetical protein
MNNQTNQTIAISISGVLSIGRQELEEILARCLRNPDAGFVLEKANDLGFGLAKKNNECVINKGHNQHENP